MHTFKYATMLPYQVHLTYEQIEKIFAFYSDRADQATMGNRSIWCLHLTENTLTIAFKCKRDQDQFAQVFHEQATIGSAPAGVRDRGGKRPARNGKRPARIEGWSQKGFSSCLTLHFDSLDPERVGRLGVAVSMVADIVTGDDRAAYEVWFHGDEIAISFRREEDCDVFANILDEMTANDEIEIFDEPSQVAPSLHPISVH